MDVWNREDFTQFGTDGLKDKFDHFFTWLVIHLATLRTNLGIIALGY